MKTALTTGANSGIGLVTAVALARAGLRSVGTVRTEAKGEILLAAARAAGVEVEVEILDVTDAPGCARVVEAVRPDVLVNNAGYAFNRAVEEVDDDQARQIVETMLLAPMRLARLAIPHMRARGAGRIIQISSIYGLTTTPLTGWYQGCKHGLEGVSDALRIEVQSSGIDVILVEPGTFKTSIWEASKEKHPGSRYEAGYRATGEAVERLAPLMGDPSDVALVIVDAATTSRPRARYLVGYDAHLLALNEALMPTAMKDWLARWTLGL